MENNDLFTGFLNTYSGWKSEKNISHKSESILKKIFHSVVTMVLDNDILVMLVDDTYKMHCVFNNNNPKYDKFKNRTLLLENYPESKKLLVESYNSNDIYLHTSDLISDTSEKYRIITISLKKDHKKCEMIIDRLSDAISNLVQQYDNTFSSYKALLNSLDAIDDGISACDINGVITYINKSGCNMIEGNVEDLLNKKLENVTNSNAILSQVIKNKKSYMDFEYFLEYRNKTFHLMNSAYPVYDENKNLLGAIDIFRRIKRTMKIATDLAGYEAFYRFENFIGKSKTLRDSIDLARRFSKNSKNILIVGESGTGKELFAQAIHNYSTRKEGPFVAINCASYPKDLFDSELFGYDEGAFTGARKGGKIGKFELANGGTLFLDEIGEMPINLQAKLLRVLETKSLSRIGSNKKVEIDVRIIAATNRNLEDMVRNNNFREDLYYRLKVLYLSLPPLIQRGSDCIELTNYFIDKFSKGEDKKIIGIDDEAKELLKSYNWPGNIRELENIIYLSLVFCDGEYITKQHLLKAGLKVNEKDIVSNNLTKAQKLSEITKEVILKTLESTNGNKRKAAEILGVSRNTIYRNSKK